MPVSLSDTQQSSTGPAPSAAAQQLGPAVLDLLRCPASGQALMQRGDALESADGALRYRISPEGIPLFAETAQSGDAERQREHYDRIAGAYEANLGYPHTRAYLDYLDAVLMETLGPTPLGITAEICCGHGELLPLLGGRVAGGVGVDISEAMLRTAAARGAPPGWSYLQGDATALPLRDASFDNVVMLGGVHHVRDRAGLFAEVARILKPGGRFLFREPLDDFWLWRGLRAAIYRLAPALDHETEQPLRRQATVPLLEASGLELEIWRPCAFLGFCLFMNSDVLVFNRLFRFVPGIAAAVRASTRLDELALRLPPLRHAGLQVVAVARRTAS